MIPWDTCWRHNSIQAVKHTTLQLPTQFLIHLAAARAPPTSLQAANVLPDIRHLRTPCPPQQSKPVLGGAHTMWALPPTCHSSAPWWVGVRPRWGFGSVPVNATRQQSPPPAQPSRHPRTRVTPTPSSTLHAAVTGSQGSAAGACCRCPPLLRPSGPRCKPDWPADAPATQHASRHCGRTGVGQCQGWEAVHTRGVVQAWGVVQA